MAHPSADSRYQAAADARIAHVRKHIDLGFTRHDLESSVAHIVNGTGNPPACAMNLSAHALAMAVSSWFERRDLTATRQWFHVGGRLIRHGLGIRTDKFGPGSHTLQMLSPLLSNDRALIDWFATYDERYDLESVEDHRTHDFWAYQAIVALRGDWQRLRARCERIMAHPPGAARQKKYQADHAFFLALANQDRPAMEAALAVLVAPKAVRGRDNDELGFTADLISTATVIYAKIAWLHGFQVQVDSPYVPSEWLPMAPLERYEAVYAFLA
jgi:hypothetical protein